MGKQTNLRDDLDAASVTGSVSVNVSAGVKWSSLELVGCWTG